MYVKTDVFCKSASISVWYMINCLQNFHCFALISNYKMISAISTKHSDDIFFCYQLNLNQWTNFRETQNLCILGDPNHFNFVIHSIFNWIFAVLIVQLLRKLTKSRTMKRCKGVEFLLLWIRSCSRFNMIKFSRKKPKFCILSVYFVLNCTYHEHSCPSHELWEVFSPASQNTPTERQEKPSEQERSIF